MGKPKIKKEMMLLGERSARLALDSLSKAALADLVVDLLRRIEGDEALDGLAFVIALREAYEPVRVVRGDKPARPDFEPMTRGRVSYPHGIACTCCQMAGCCNQCGAAGRDHCTNGRCAGCCATVCRHRSSF